jgi:lipopolysaccharide biosynthesis glycosyltransferase
MISVGFAADSRLRKPLKVACGNLLKSNPTHTFDIHAVLDGWTDKDVCSLRNKLDTITDQYNLTEVKWDPARFRGLNPFRGGLTCYSIFDLFDSAESSRILYLDADTIPNAKVPELAALRLNDNLLGAVTWNATAKNSHESSAYLQAGLKHDAHVFNSGVLLVDTHQWRERHCTDEAISLGRTLGTQVTGDQTLLNIIARDRFLSLPWSYNVSLHHNDAPYRGDGIVHFVGRPKPWSLRGWLTHGNYRLWQRAASAVGERPIQFSA